VYIDWKVELKDANIARNWIQNSRGVLRREVIPSGSV
jgi:hypothetical protein